MSFLQLVFSLDKTFEGINSILENMSILTDIATIRICNLDKFALHFVCLNQRGDLTISLIQFTVFQFSKQVETSN